MIFAVSGLPAWADAARISAGGAVHQMHGGGSVSMERETVRIKISDHLQEVECTFVFNNKGPACSLHVGFPDFTNIPDLSSEAAAAGLTPTFLTYHCEVDGKECKSKLIPADDDYSGSDDVMRWHASVVQFPAHSKVTMRTDYSQLPDISPTDMKEPIQQFIKVTRYILQTAASWDGPVKQADIYVTFDKKIAPAPLKLVSLQEMNNSKARSSKAWWQKASDHTVCYSASARPIVNGQQLHLVLRNFHPTENDDLLLIYQRMNIRQAINYASYVEKVEKRLSRPKLPGKAKPLRKSR